MILALVIVSTASLAWQPPGAIDSTCTQDLVCQAGYTRTVRPLASFTAMLKDVQMNDWSLPGQPKDYEEDHFIPLELCGHPRMRANLWPQPIKEARQKDQVEDLLHKKVCAGEMTLEAAQAAIHHWREVSAGTYRLDQPLTDSKEP